jgi:hypothetical protein
VSGSRRPTRYEIRVDGVPDDQWADWFGGLQLSKTARKPSSSDCSPTQETGLRASHAGTSAVVNMTAWLTTIVGRACLDMLRHASAGTKSSLA